MDEKETLFVIEMSTHAWDQSGYISNNFKPDHLGFILILHSYKANAV